MTEEEIIAQNSELIKNEDTEIVCHDHNIKRRWGDLSPIAQLAVLAGIDCNDKCIMEENESS